MNDCGRALMPDLIFPGPGGALIFFWPTILLSRKDKSGRGEKKCPRDFYLRPPIVSRPTSRS